jgi:hypothetical protein
VSKDLFGNEITEQDKKTVGKYQIYRKRFNYREGNPDMCCKRCEHCQLYMPYHGNKQYYKCELQGISNCESSDIRLKNVCDNFKKDGE